jgi:hypothetical protein
MTLAAIPITCVTDLCPALMLPRDLVSHSRSAMFCLADEPKSVHTACALLIQCMGIAVGPPAPEYHSYGL